MAHIYATIAAIIMAVAIQLTKSSELSLMDLLITNVMTVYGAAGSYLVVYIIARDRQNHKPHSD